MYNNKIVIYAIIMMIMTTVSCKVRTADKESKKMGHHEKQEVFTFMHAHQKSDKNTEFIHFRLSHID